MPPLSLQRDLCFVEVIEGETDDLRRQRSESTLVERLSRSGITLQHIELTAAGCFVMVACADLEPFKDAVRTLNVAIRVTDHCGRIALEPGTRSASSPLLASVIAALLNGSIRIIHFLANAAELVVLVDARQIQAAMIIMNRFTVQNAPCIV